MSIWVDNTLKPLCCLSHSPKPKFSLIETTVEGTYPNLSIRTTKLKAINTQSYRFVFVPQCQPPLLYSTQCLLPGSPSRSIQQPYSPHRLQLMTCSLSIPPPPNSNNILLAKFFFGYAIVCALSRLCSAAGHARLAVIHELNWACNSALILSSIGFSTCRPQLAVGAGIAVSIDQVLWYVDVFGYLIYPKKKFLVGVCKYLTWTTTSWIRLATSTHHLWTIPLIVLGAKNDLGGWRTQVLSHVIVSLHVFCSRLLTPKGLEDGRYLNVNLSWEIWEDIKKFETVGNGLWQVSNPSPWKYMRRLLPRWFFFNTLCSFLIWVLTKLTTAKMATQVFK